MGECTGVSEWAGETVSPVKGLSRHNRYAIIPRSLDRADFTGTHRLAYTKLIEVSITPVQASLILPREPSEKTKDRGATRPTPATPAKAD